VPDAAQQRGDTVGFNSSQPLYGSRDINSAFGEFGIPVFSPDMEIPALYSFNVTAAVRYDEYSDFGNTVNPKVQIRGSRGRDADLCAVPTRPRSVPRHSAICI
jgi:hypothetical protein